jgi:hypothetical protein
MTDLSPQARAIVESSRSGPALTRADRDRIKRGVLVRASTAVAATSTAGAAVAMSLASKITLVAAAAAVLGGGAIALSAARARTTAPSRVAREISPPRENAATVLPPTVPQESVAAPGQATNPVVAESSKKPGKRPLTTGASTSGTASSVAVGPLDSELEVLRQAREELRRGLPESAYRRLVDYDQRHGKGVLAQERQALSAIALCQWRPGPDAQARAAEFLRNAPLSPLVDRVHLACDRANGPTK